MPIGQKGEASGWIRREFASTGAVLGKNPADANASAGSKGKAALRVGNIINNMPKTPQGFAKVPTYDCLHIIVIPEGFRQSLHTPSPYVMTLILSPNAYALDTIHA